MKTVATLIVYDTDETHRKLDALFASTDAAKTDSYVIAVDTKSVAGTEEWIRAEVSGDVFPYEFDDDFAAARNLTLARIPSDADWWYWIDSDDTLEMTAGKTLPEVLEEVPSNVNAIGFLYDYEHDQYGNKTTTHRRGRLYRANLKWEWRGAVHEDVYPVDHGGVRPLALKSEDLLWVHHTEDRPSSLDRNMKILRKMLEKDPEDARTWYYVGNAMFAARDFPKAAEAYGKYVDISGWDLERYMALIYQAMAYREMGLFDKGMEADTKAMHLMPNLADAYFGLGEGYARLRQWTKALHFGQLGMKAVSEDGIPDADMFVNLNAYAFKPYMWMADCYLELGMNDRALDCLETAYKQRPEVELERGIDHVKWATSRQRIVDNGIDLAAGLIRRNEPLKAKAILENLPAGESSNPNVAMALAHVNRSIAHLYDPTAYSNLYFTEEEAKKPEDVLPDINTVPRMTWALRRLKAAGVKKVLDLGIGNGTQALYFVQNGIQVVGIDVDRRRVKDANFAAVRMGFLQMKEVDFGDVDDPWRVEVPDITPDSLVQFHYCRAEELSQQVRDLGPYDAVICSELIEHVLEPEQLLAMCESVSNRVILTTPDGTYDGPQERNPGHVRAWSQREFTALIGTRGRINEIHLVSHVANYQKNIVGEYIVGEIMSDEAVIIWCFDTGQGWTPDSIREGGIGGSETAVIRVAEELVKRGKRVTVYAECEGVWNGVRYAKSKDFRPQPCELFVSWRSIGPLPVMADLASRRFLWCHDINAGDIPADQLTGVTVLALSEWHRGILQQKYPTATVVLSGNGIDPERFDKDIQRVKHRLIYAQSPDRGLHMVLREFPAIRNRYPDATLEIFYGLDLARARMPEYIAHLEQSAKQPGVTLHGRINQEQLAEEYLKADALLYPAIMPNGQPFDETYCISVVEALAAGCFPITADHGALRTTNQGGAFYRHPVWADALRELYAFWDRPRKERENIRDHGNLDKYQPTMPLSGKRWAVQQTWAKVVDGWLALLAEPESHLVPDNTAADDIIEVDAKYLDVIRLGGLVV